MCHSNRHLEWFSINLLLRRINWLCKYRWNAFFLHLYLLYYHFYNCYMFTYNILTDHVIYRFWLQIRYLQTLHVLVSRLGMNCYSMWKNLICVTKDPSYVMFVLVTISCSLRFHDLTDFKKRNTNIATITATTTYLSVLFFFLVLVSQSLIFSVFCESLYIFPI